MAGVWSFGGFSRVAWAVQLVTDIAKRCVSHPHILVSSGSKN
jgi:hypothetical protein